MTTTAYPDTYDRHGDLLAINGFRVFIDDATIASERVHVLSFIDDHPGPGRDEAKAELVRDCRRLLHAFGLVVEPEP